MSFCTLGQEEEGGAMAVNPFEVSWAGSLWRPLIQPELLVPGRRYAVAEVVGNRLRIVLGNFKHVR